MAQNRKARLQERRSFALGLVRRILLRVVSGDLDPHEGFGQVRTIYVDESELLAPDLKALADKADSESSEEMIAAAQKWLGENAAVP